MMDIGLKTTFLPSEVARLVLGYLKEQMCSKAAEYFLRDCVHLAEYRSMLEQGFAAPLSIGGRTLVEVLCLCQLDQASNTEGKDKAELWDKLDHIVSQLKSFSASVNPENTQPVPKAKLTRPVRIRQTGIKGNIRPCDVVQKSVTSTTIPPPDDVISVPPEQDFAVGSATMKKHVRWNLPDEQAASREESHSSITVISKDHVETSEETSTDTSGAASTKSIMKRHRFSSADGAKREEPTHEELVADPVADSSFNTSTEDSLPDTSDNLSKKATLRLPEEHYEWSPCKSLAKGGSKVQTPEKTDIDQEVSDLLNELFPMKNVVHKLVHDDTWTQDLAKSINEKKDNQSHLVEESIPQILDITRDDPNFTEFHSLLEDGSKRRKGKPIKKRPSSHNPLQAVDPVTTYHGFTQYAPIQPHPTAVPNPTAVPITVYQQQQKPVKQQTGYERMDGSNEKTVIGLKGIRRKKLFADTSSGAGASVTTSQSMHNKMGKRKRKQNLEPMAAPAVPLPNDTQPPLSQSTSSVAPLSQLPGIGTLLPPSSMYVVLAPANTAPHTSVIPQPSLLPITLQSPNKYLLSQPLSSTIEFNFSSNTQLPGTQAMASQCNPVLGAQTILPGQQSTCSTQSQWQLPVSQLPVGVQSTWQAVEPQSTSSANPSAPSQPASEKAAQSVASLVTPGKDSDSMDIEQATALLFSGVSPAGKRKKSNKHNTSHSGLGGDNETQYEDTSPAVTKQSEAVTSKWSPALKKLVETCSPVKPARKRTTHVRHLSFSPNSIKSKRSPLRKSSAVTRELSPGISVLRTGSPGTPADEPPTDLPFHRLTKPSPQLRKSPEQVYPVQGVRKSPNFLTSTRSPPSVGGTPDPATPTVSSPFSYSRYCSTPVPSPLISSPATPLHSPSVQAPRRSPRTSAKSSPSTVRPHRRMVPIARKGGPPVGGRYTPSKRNSPSIVMAGKRASITSITVGQSTPKGKNCIPTEISSTDLQKAVDAILDDGSNDLLDSIGQCSNDAYTHLTSSEFVEASGMASGRADSSGSHYDSDDTVGVVQALMELASSESPAKTPIKTAEHLDKDIMPPPSESTSSHSRGQKRKSSPSTKQKKKERRTAKKMLKNMNIQSMLDMIHK